MARKRMVTRTFKGMKVTVLCLDVNDAEPFNETIEIPRVIDDSKKLQKYISENYDTEDIKYVKVVDTEIIEDHRAMTEEFFFANSVSIKANKDEKEND